MYIGLKIFSMLILFMTGTAVLTCLTCGVVLWFYVVRMLEDM